MEKFAVLGCGVVGSGVVELFEKNRTLIEARCGKSLAMGYILDLRDFPDKPYADKVVHDITPILDDPDVSVVAECMGGVEPAFTFVKSCLEHGKSVATSNKELVAKKGDILLKTAEEHHCNFFFEASVGGAIPIIRPLHKCLAANDFSAVAGILNGTTNFILEKMVTDCMDFAPALKLAQELGYAEKDPTADIEGHDACRKICIISSLVFGKHVYPESVKTKGISDVKYEHCLLAKEHGYALKLIASVARLEDGTILPMVRPMFVQKSNLLSQVNDVFNAVMVDGDGFDRAMFYGRGAGKFPTASAVLGDMIEQVQLSDTIQAQRWNSSESQDFIADPTAFKAKRFLYISRMAAGDSVPLADIVGQPNTYIDDTETAGILLIYHDVTDSEVEQMITELKAHGVSVFAEYPILQ